jgi:arsenite methyltransferase
MSHSDKDQWFEWLLHRRFGGDEQAMNEAMAMLVPIRDRVLDNARLEAGSVVLDVGTGDGLIAFGALERVGKSGRVIFCDISEDLVAHCQTLAREMGVSERCEFVVAPAEDLRATASGSVDAVTVRSVLIYVKDKLAAFREFFRVLKTGGTVSLFEPVNRFCYDPSPDWFWGYHVAPVQSAALKVRRPTVIRCWISTNEPCWRWPRRPVSDGLHSTSACRLNPWPQNPGKLSRSAL